MAIQTSERTPEKTKTGVLAIGGRFKGFQPEEEKSSSKVEVKETAAVRRMKAAWRACGYDSDGFNDWNYPSILKSVENLQIRAEDVELFSLALAEFQQEEGFSNKGGLFLSALMNSGKDGSYIISTGHLAEPLNNIGYQNERDIAILGDAGDDVGMGMIGGRITVNGSAGTGVGRIMRSGSIIIGRDADIFTGAGMIGGRITIRGYAEAGIGYFMKDGEIRLEGDYRRLSTEIVGGLIYHKGELIYPR